MSDEDAFEQPESEGNDSNDVLGGAEFDPQRTGAMLGLSERQLKFAMARLRGLNRSRAAKAAGYAGDADSLRSVGSQVDRSSKVQNFLKIARAHGADDAEEPADGGEVRKILSRIARGGGVAAVSACRELALIESRTGEEARQQEETDPFKILDKISRYCFEAAWLFAKREGIDHGWSPPADAAPQRFKMVPVDPEPDPASQPHVDPPTTPGDAARQRYIHELNSGLRNHGDRTASPAASLATPMLGDAAGVISEIEEVN